MLTYPRVFWISTYRGNYRGHTTKLSLMIIMFHIVPGHLAWKCSEKVNCVRVDHIVIGRPHIISQLLGAISPWLWPPCRTSTGFKLERFKGESPAWKVMVVQNLDRKNWASDLHLRPKKGRKPNRIHPWNDGIFTMRNMWAKHEKMEMSWDNSWKIGRVYQAKCLAVSHEKWRFTISYPLTNPMISM